MVTKNAIIEAATIRIERGFILDCSIQVNYGGSVQGYGGFVLGGSAGSAAGDGHATSGNYAAEFLMRCMAAADVEDWAHMKGRAVRVQTEDGWGGSILAIGHIIRDDRWFNARETFAAWKAAKPESP
ncbi:MAG: hypothetical protein AB7I42_24075 [Bradyrhizobium sp.]|uniref:hypothetical protein n=1 Tax=Bradyrhizobium sp. TaxID=376 RepID=UPI003D10AC5E